MPLTYASNIYPSIHYVIIIIPGYQNKYSHKLKYCWKTAERPKVFRYHLLELISTLVTSRYQGLHSFSNFKILSWSSFIIGLVFNSKNQCFFLLLCTLNAVSHSSKAKHAVSFQFILWTQHIQTKVHLRRPACRRGWIWCLKTIQKMHLIRQHPHTLIQNFSQIYVFFY